MTSSRFAPAETKAMLNRAAQSRGHNLSGFMLESARRQDEEAIARATMPWQRATRRRAGRGLHILDLSLDHLRAAVTVAYQPFPASGVCRLRIMLSSTHRLRQFPDMPQDRRFSG